MRREPAKLAVLIRIDRDRRPGAPQGFARALELLLDPPARSGSLTR